MELELGAAPIGVAVCCIALCLLVRCGKRRALSYRTMLTVEAELLASKTVCNLDEWLAAGGAAAAEASPPRRIVLVGCAGAGKSTLATQLGRRLKTPVVDCDELFWTNNCPTYKDFSELLTAELEHNPSSEKGYICDGSYMAALGTFGWNADIIVWLEPGAVTRTARVCRRTCHDVRQPALASSSFRAQLGSSLVERLVRLLRGLVWDVDKCILYSAAGINQHRPNIINNLAAFHSECVVQNRRRRLIAALAGMYRTGTKESQRGPTNKEKKAAKAAKAAARAGDNAPHQEHCQTTSVATVISDHLQRDEQIQDVCIGEDARFLDCKLTLKQCITAVGGGINTVWDTKARKRVLLADLFVGVADDAETISAALKRSFGPFVSRDSLLKPKMTVRDLLTACSPALYERLHNAAQEYPDASLERLQEQVTPASRESSSHLNVIAHLIFGS